MVVWVAETGCYEDQGVQGIYDSAERAMAALPGKTWTRTVYTHFPKWPDTSEVSHWNSWSNDLDWDEAASVTPYEVTDSGALRPVDAVLEQRLRPGDPNGGWNI